MNKLFKTIGAISLGLAMAAGVAVGASKIEQVSAADVTLKSADVVTAFGYAPYSNDDAVITFGGNNKSVGTNSSNRSKCVLGDTYAKYASKAIETNAVGAAFVSLKSHKNRVGISYTFNGGSNQTSTNVYAIYSADNITFAQLTLTSGKQGAAISSETTFSFAKCDGYFGLLFVATNSSGNWRIDSVEMKLIEDNGSVTEFTVTYDGNGATSGTAPKDSTKYTNPSDVTILGNTGNLEKTGYTYSGWNSKEDGTGTDYVAGNSYNLTKDTTFYAKWTINQYTVTYDANGATGTVPEAETVDYNTSITIATPSDLSVTDKVFDSWNTSDDGTGTKIGAGTSYKVTENITLYAIFSDAKYYAPISALSDIADGSKIIIASSDKKTAMSTTQNDNNRSSTSVTFTEGKGFAATPSVQVLTLEAVDGKDNTYYLNTGDGYLYDPNTKSKNYLRTGTTKDEWVVSLTSDVLYIKSSTSNKFIKKNLNSALYSCYASGQIDIIICKLVEASGASAYADKFLSELTCDGTGASAPSTSKWGELNTAFAALSTDDKNIFKNGEASESGTNIQKCLARYDYVVAKYGKAVYADFMDRNPVASVSSLTNIHNENSNSSTSIIVIVAIAMASVTGLGVLLALKRRKGLVK